MPDNRTSNTVARPVSFPARESGGGAAHGTAQESLLLEYVGFWPRLGAFIIDHILIGLVLTPAYYHFFFSRIDQENKGVFLEDNKDQENKGVFLEDNFDLLITNAQTSIFDNDQAIFLLLFTIVPAVMIISFWLAKQATPGKMVFGARIVDANTGRSPSPRQCILRYCGYLGMSIPYIVYFFFLGFVWMGFDPRKQGFHDKIARTVVVRPKRVVTFDQKYDQR